MKELETLKLYRGATSVIELDFTGFTFENNSYCQLTIKKKYNDDIVFQHDFDKPIKYYVTFKDEFTASLDDDKYEYDIMYMLKDERYPQCSISDIVIDEVVNEYKGEFNAEAVQVTEVLSEGAEVTQTIKVTTSNVIIASSNLQERTVTPTKEEQVVLAEDGFDGMSKVVVEAIPSDYVIPNLQEKEARITAPTNIFVHPDEEYDGLSFVNVIASVDTETKEVTPSKEVQNISRSDGKYIESVIVNAIPDNYIEPSGEMEITENGSYDVTDKASVKVETSGADLSEYFEINPTEIPQTSVNPFFYTNYIKKVPDIVIPDSVTSVNFMFGSTYQFFDFPLLPKIIFNNNVTEMKGTYSYIKNFNKSKTSLDFSEINTENVTDMSSCFRESIGLTELDLKSFKTSNVTDMNYMFYGCNKLASLDVSNFDTSKVTDMSYMFYNCRALTTFDLSNFDTKNVKNMKSMFNSCQFTNIDLSTFDTQNVEDMSQMFTSCAKLTSLNLNNWNTNSLKTLTGIFQSCSSLAELTLNNWNTSNVTSMSQSFQDCKALTSLNLSGWDTSNVTSMSGMFKNCTALTYLDIRNFDFTKVTSYTFMFGNSASYGPPDDCEIIVKDDTAKNWLNANYSRLTNVKTVAELGE